MKILNAGPGFSQPMTEDETISFLTTGRRNIYIASLDEKNEPNIPYKGVRGKARIDIISDIDSIVPICERNMKKYLGSLEHPMAKELVNLAKNGESVAIEISPLYFSTWDDGKVKFQ